MYFADMIIEKGVPFLLQAGLNMKQLSWLVIKERLFQKINFSKRLISLKYTLYRPLSLQISTFSKACREVLFKHEKNK